MKRDSLSQPAAPPRLWRLDSSILFLNHGSFGACPRSVLRFQEKLRERLEAEPITFFVRDLEAMLDQARGGLARFVGASTENLVFVPNATAGVNTVLRSLRLKPGEELLVTNHEYNACRNALEFAAERSGTRTVVVQIPFPIRSPTEVLEPIVNGITQRTRLVLLDHVTSQTGLILPLKEIIRELSERGIEVLVDGAHAPGMIPLNLEKLGATYYTGNCHKWLCAPKGAAFLYVRPDRQKEIRPLSISHGANSPRKDRSRFLIEFGWTGTWDSTAMLSVPAAIKTIGQSVPGGWKAVMTRNRALALAGRKLICGALGVPLPSPDEMIGSLASIPLPPGKSDKPSKSPLYLDPLQERLMKAGRIEVPIIPWPRPPNRLLRISAHLYNSLPQYELLTEALTNILARER